MNGPTNLELAYMAGVVDSDGYIGVHRRKAGEWAANYQPRIQVKQVTPEAIDLFATSFGGHRYDGKPTTEKGRPLLVWQAHSAAAGRACEALLPYLRIKRRQAENVLVLCEVNSRLGRRRFPVPEVVPGEPMVTMAEAARRIGKSYGTVIQAVRNGSVPHVRTGPRQVRIPESFLPVWAERGTSPRRDPALTTELEACYNVARELNRVGI